MTTKTFGGCCQSWQLVRYERKKGRGRWKLVSFLGGFAPTLCLKGEEPGNPQRCPVHRGHCDLSENGLGPFTWSLDSPAPGEFSIGFSGESMRRARAVIICLSINHPALTRPSHFPIKYQTHSPRPDLSGCPPSPECSFSLLNKTLLAFTFCFVFLVHGHRRRGEKDPSLEQNNQTRVETHCFKRWVLRKITPNFKIGKQITGVLLLQY